MLYMIWVVSVVASLTVSTIANEIATKYIALYFVANEAADLGVRYPEPEQLINDQRTAASDTLPGQTTGGSRIGAVMPVLITGTVATGLTNASLVLPDSGVDAEALAAAGMVINAHNGEVQGTNDAVDWTRAAGADSLTTHPVLAKLVAADEGIVIDGAQEQVILELARDTPYRLSDGTAFLPIATQRLFSMRWAVSRREDVPMAFEISGHVITDPDTGRVVPAVLSGVIEANQGTFPYLGMAVRKGDILGYLRPTMALAEHAQINARIEQLVNLISLNEKQIDRLSEVLFVRYRVNKIEALKLQIDGNRRELLALQSSLDNRQVLRATVDGVISHIGAVIGGTVSQGEELFEIVDPSALWVEVAAYDPSIGYDISSATAIVGDGQTIDLEFVGGGLVLTNQVVPLRFRVLNAPEGLTVGVPVTVIVQQERTITGIPVPASSIVRDGDGRSIVWERMSAETFSPRQVRATRVAGNVMVVLSGMSSGARVVVDGAIILNQVR